MNMLKRYRNLLVLLLATMVLWGVSAKASSCGNDEPGEIVPLESCDKAAAKKRSDDSCKELMCAVPKVGACEPGSYTDTGPPKCTSKCNCTCMMPNSEGPELGGPTIMETTEF